jgi:hypothetical protein
VVELLKKAQNGKLEFLLLNTKKHNVSPNKEELYDKIEFSILKKKKRTILSLPNT